MHIVNLLPKRAHYHDINGDETREEMRRIKTLAALGSLLWTQCRLGVNSKVTVSTEQILATFFATIVCAFYFAVGTHFHH